MSNSASIQKMMFGALLVETICVTYGLYLPRISAMLSILYVAAGIVITICFLYTPGTVTAPANKKIGVFLSVLLLPIFFYFGNRWMNEEPLSYQSADMLPVIQTMCERWLAGHWYQVYDPMPQIWHGMVPVYLPAMWLPYSIPVALGIDVRWLTIFSLLLVYWIFLRRISLRKQEWPLILAALLLLCFLLTSEKCGLIPFSEEGLVILYYVLMVRAVERKNPWLIGTCAALCLLSRYALIGWLPAMLLYYAWRKDRKTLWQAAISAVVCCMLLVLPFGWKNFQSLLALPASYIDFAGRVWHDSPEVFTEGIGLARFFGPGHIALQHWLLITFSLIIPSLCMLLLLWFSKKTGISENNIPLAVLKLTLLIFFSMVDVPYLYLFYTASFVSIFMNIEQGTRNIE